MSDDFVEEICVDEKKNLKINWTFNIIKNNHVSWGGYCGGWGSLSKNEEVDNLIDDIDKIENKIHSCVICGGERRGSQMHNHHLISNSMSVHPTGTRILDSISIGVCSACHCGNSGFLHSLDKDQGLVREKYSKLVEEKMNQACELINEVDKLSLEYELKITNSMLKKIKYTFKDFKKFKKLNDESRK